MELQITNRMRVLAEKYEGEVLAALKERFPDGSKNYTDLDHPKKFYFGYLGEFLFLKYCSLNDIKCDYTVKTNGFAEKSDFIFFTKEGSIKVEVDVKTRSRDWHDLMIIPDKQYYLYTYDYYIGVRLISNESGYIHGYCTKNELMLNEKGYPPRNKPSYQKSLYELHNISDLFNRIEKGKIDHNLPTKNEIDEWLRKK